ncbi:MAG: TMEM175 family protein [Acidobacteriota bacterium]|nr:TMEM175 family protein [Acidobacteriota bacterium]
MTKERMESFSDGIFAFAITLLVLGIQVPDLKLPNDSLLASALLQAAPQLIPYITSFATIGVIWLNHHSMFHNVEKVTHTTLSLNLLLLLVIAFIPFPTAVLGRYGPMGSAVLLYGATFSALGLSYNLLWLHILRNRLSRDCRDEDHAKSHTMRNLLGSLIYPAATAIAFVAPRISLTIFFVLAGFYFIPGLRPAPTSPEAFDGAYKSN